MASRSVIQLGVYEGSPCIELSAFDWNPNDPEELVRVCLKAMAPGIDLINVGTDLPWGSVELEHGLGAVLAHPTLSDLRLWRLTTAADDRWSTFGAHTVMDCSDMVYATTDYTALAKELYQVSQSPDEVVLLDPPHTLTHVLLDEILGRLYARNGYIYSPTPGTTTYDLLTQTVIHACTRWSIRRL